MFFATSVFFCHDIPNTKTLCNRFFPPASLIHEPLLCLREETEDTGLIFYSLIFRSLRAGSNFGGFLEKTRGEKGCSNIFVRFKAPSCWYSFALFWEIFLKGGGLLSLGWRMKTNVQKKFVLQITCLGMDIWSFSSDVAWYAVEGGKGRNRAFGVKNRRKRVSLHHWGSLELTWFDPAFSFLHLRAPQVTSTAACVLVYWTSHFLMHANCCSVS